MKKNCEDPESQSRWPILEFFWMDEQSLTLKPCENVEHCGSRVAPGFEAEKHQVFGRVGRCTQVTGYITVTFPTKTCASGTCFFFFPKTPPLILASQNHMCFFPKRNTFWHSCVSSKEWMWAITLTQCVVQMGLWVGSMDSIVPDAWYPVGRAPDFSPRLFWCFGIRWNRASVMSTCR